MATILLTTFPIFYFKKLLYFYHNYTEVCSYGYNWKWISIGLGRPGDKPLPEPKLTIFNVYVHVLQFICISYPSISHMGNNLLGTFSEKILLFSKICNCKMVRNMRVVLKYSLLSLSYPCTVEMLLKLQSYTSCPTILTGIVWLC